MSDDSDGLSPYELQRVANIQRNNQYFVQLQVPIIPHPVAQAHRQATPGQRMPAAASTRAAVSTVQTRTGLRSTAPLSSTFGEIRSAPNGPSVHMGPASRGPVRARQLSPDGRQSSDVRDSTADAARPATTLVARAQAWCKQKATQLGTGACSWCTTQQELCLHVWTDCPEKEYTTANASNGNQFMNHLTTGMKCFIVCKVLLFVILLVFLQPLRGIKNLMTTWLFFDLKLFFDSFIGQHIMPCVFNTKTKKNLSKTDDWQLRPEMKLLQLYIRLAFCLFLGAGLLEVYIQDTQCLAMQYILYLIMYYVLADLADHTRHNVLNVFSIVYCMFVWHQNDNFSGFIFIVPCCMSLMVHVMMDNCFDKLSLQNYSTNMLNKKNEVVVDGDEMEHRLDSVSFVRNFTPSDRFEMRLFVVCISFCSMIRTAFWMQKYDIYMDNNLYVSIFMLSHCFASLLELCLCADVNVGLNAFLMPCAVSRTGCLRMVAEFVYFLCSTQLKSMLSLEENAFDEIEKAAQMPNVKKACVCIVIFVQALQLLQMVFAHSYCTVDRAEMLLGMKSANLLLLKAAMKTCLDDYCFYFSLVVSVMMFEALRDDSMIAVIIVLTFIASMTYSNRSLKVFEWCKKDTSTTYHLYIRNLTVHGVFTTDNCKALRIFFSQVGRIAVDYIVYCFGSTVVICFAYVFNLWKVRDGLTEYAACGILIVPLAFILLFKLSYAKDNEKQWAMGVEQSEDNETRTQAFNARWMNEVRKYMTPCKVQTNADIMRNSDVVPTGIDVRGRGQPNLPDILKAIKAGKSKKAHVTAQFLKPARFVDVTVDVQVFRVVAWKIDIEEPWTSADTWTLPQQMLMGVIAIIHGGVKFDQRMFNQANLSDSLLAAANNGQLRFQDMHGNQQEDHQFFDRYTEAINSLHEVKDKKLCCEDVRCSCQDKLAENAHFCQLWANLAEPPQEAALNGLLQLFVIPADNDSKLPSLPAAGFFSSALAFVGLPPKR